MERLSLLLYERNLEGGSLAGDPEGHVGKALETASLSTGAPLGNLEEGSPTRDFDRRMKGALGMGRLTLKRLSGEGLERGRLLYWGPWKIC
jgi:hypothetical protein